MQHVAHRHSDEVAQLNDEIERLRAALDTLLEVAHDVVSDGEATLNPGLLALAQVAIAQAEQALKVAVA